MKKKISFVIPAYNEQANLPLLIDRIVELLSDCFEYEIIIVNDGSSDKTFEVAQKLSKTNKQIFYISLSRNFGHQNALKAGIDFSSGDCVISLDADLQHPPELIPQMIQKWQEGFHIVYTKRKENKELSFFKRKTSNLFYGLMNQISDINIETGMSDYRLIDKKIITLIKENQEYDLFFRGYINWVGFKKYKISYQPAKRHSGESKYTFLKMFRFALTGITSFSVKPLHISTFIGFFSAFCCIFMIAWVLYFRLNGSKAFTGYSIIMIVMFFFTSVQMLAIGILGEYVGKLFIQSKNRPNYIIEETNIKPF